MALDFYFMFPMELYLYSKDTLTTNRGPRTCKELLYGMRVIKIAI